MMGEPKEAAMAEPDTTLEEALEAVLVRYGIPAYGLRKGVLEADRGDMASDLADAARRVLPRPDPDGYALVLSDLYVKLRMTYEAHPEHRLAPARDDTTRVCRCCGGAMTVIGEDEKHCGGPDPTDRCDTLSRHLWDIVEEAFPVEESARWLAAPPAADFLSWGDGGGGICWGTIGELVASVLRYDAGERIMAGLIPADPMQELPA